MLTNKTVILDASVIVKWFHTEEDDEVARAIRARLIQDEMRAIVPSLLFYEVANALLFKSSSEEQVIEALKYLRNIEGLRTDHTFNLSLDGAIFVSKRFKVSIYDAVYVALAVELNLPFITADKKLIAAVKSPLIYSLHDLEL